MKDIGAHWRITPRNTPTGRLAPWTAARLFPFLLACLVAAVLQAFPVQAGRVAVVAGPSIDPALIATMEQAIAACQRFFLEQLGLALDHDVTLVLARDKQEFTRVLADASGKSPDLAARRAELALGISVRATIIEDCDRLRNATEQAFVACHELTHQYQAQISGSRHHQVRWISEGTADCVAAMVVDRMGLRTEAAYHKQWGRRLRGAADRPRLEDLEMWPTWVGAEHRYGGTLVYRVSDVGVLRLAQRGGGLEPFIVYFRRLQAMDAEEAFRQAFGVGLKAFEAQADDPLP